MSRMECNSNFILQEVWNAKIIRKSYKKSKIYLLFLLFVVVYLRRLPLQLNYQRGVFYLNLI